MADFQRLNATNNANIAIQSTCELFISSIYASRRDSNYDCTAFTTQTDNLEEMNDTIAYIMSQNQYQREIADYCNYNIVSDAISFNDFNATVTGDLCNAEIAVHYTYEMTGEFNGTFYMNCMYFLTLEKQNDCWRIVSAKTSMPNEQGDDFTYGAFNAHAAAVSVVRDHDAGAAEEELVAVTDSTVKSKSSKAEIKGPAYSYKTTSYSPTSAINYASNYYNQTNSLFGASGQNCQNFASQCVWAGLRSGCNGSGTSTTEFPAVSTSWSGSNAANVWCRNQCSTYYSNYTLNWAWDNVNGFLKLILVSDHTQVGPQGYYWQGLSNACAGDVIAWDTSGSRSVNNGDFDHAMFVTQVTGTKGSRGVSNICIAANSAPTTSAFMPLAQYCSYSASCFATAQITGGYYWVSNY